MNARKLSLSIFVGLLMAAYGREEAPVADPGLSAAAAAALAGGASARFYERVDDQGASFGAGADSAWVGQAWTDRVSSVQALDGFQVELLGDVDYGSAALELGADLASLVGLGFNDRASSLKVGRTGVGGTPGAPKPVAKRVDTLVFAHVMPWFESKAFSGYWGQHWTMANQNPDVIGGGGRRQIAAHYYPLIGPYASADPDVIEYQLLLMKFSGIDGVLIDWPGLADLYDYPRNRANAETMIARLGEVGLTFGVVYEDQNVSIAARQGVVTDKLGQARADMAYLQNNYFSQSTYVRINGRPLLGVFGPQTFQAPGEWQQIFSGLSTKPCFVTLWYEHPEAAGSSDCTGEYSWVVEDDARTHLQHLRDFYAGRPNYGVKMGSAYPGFHDFYAQGGWGSSNFYVAANGTATFSETLELALGSGVPYVQLATWNDYGEGTMLEPTREFGYGLLTTLQEKLGVPYGQSELELVAALYAQRRQYRGDAAQRARLDRAAAFLAALQIGAARSTLAETP